MGVMLISKPKQLEDVYYIGTPTFIRACKDYDTEVNKMNPASKILFFSFCIRKKFNQEVCYSPDCIADYMCNHKDHKDHKDIFQGNILISESFKHDDIGRYVDLIKLSGTIEVVKLEISSILIAANLRAAETAGKVKFVCIPSGMALIKEIIKSNELPLIAITEEEASKEIEEIHTYLLQLRKK